VSDHDYSPLWLQTYLAFTAETDLAKLRKLLEALEIAMWNRLQEMDGSEQHANERRAMDWVSEQVLEIKVTKLGFPRWYDHNGDDAST
jgi:hypothetical protein